MKTSPSQSITTAPISPVQDRHLRMIKYAVTMGVRIVCIALIFVVPFPWSIVPIAGAVFLPYFAVIAANVSSRTVTPMRQVDHLILEQRDSSGSEEAAASATIEQRGDRHV